ncbi:Uncharacterised protein [Mycobacteroides abscessus subsp. massiliense]|nr:Uncharacterised protein [Mycobacteroides abscessus subsp. massiliense]
MQPAIEDVLAQDKILRVLTTALQDAEDPDRAIKGLNADAVARAVFRTFSNGCSLSASAASSNVYGRFSVIAPIPFCLVNRVNTA